MEDICVLLSYTPSTFGTEKTLKISGSMLNWEDCGIKIKFKNQKVFHFLANKHTRGFLLMKQTSENAVYWLFLFGHFQEGQILRPSCFILNDENTVQQSLGCKILWLQVLPFILSLAETGLYLSILPTTKEHSTKILIS